MLDDLQLNVPLLRRRVPNLTVAAKGVGLRAATVSNLCSGKIPLGRAEVRTLVALASLAGCTVDELILRGAGHSMIETGIKLFDLFAPLVRGATVGLVARQGLGQMVMATELVHRLRQRGFLGFLWAPPEPHADLNEVAAVADGSATKMDDLLDMIIGAANERDVLLVTDRSKVLDGDLLILRERLAEAGARPITVALVDAQGQAPDEEAPYGPLETLWRFDTDLAVHGLFPAVDPVRSTSTLLEGNQLEATHLTVQQRARKLLRRYQELRPLVRARGVNALPESDAMAYWRGERLTMFLTQPVYVAEPFTGLPGEWVSLLESIDGVRRILDGAADTVPPESLKFTGRFSPPQESAAVESEE